MADIYEVSKNSDMTEGRGRMVVVARFRHEEDAHKFMDKQPGCMGRKQKWSDPESGGDWQCVKHFVHEGPYNEEEEKLKEIFKKLSPQEVHLLAKYYRKELT